MNRMDARTILISEPNADTQFAFYPYVWAVLKTYYEDHGRHVDRFRWLDPIYNRGTAEEMLAATAGRRIDVLGLSCYTWNWKIQCALAREVKRRHPSCLVVAGGPDPDFKDPRFFIDHPYIDVVVVKDGEIPFARILDAMVEGGELQQIPGLYLPKTASQHALALASEESHHYTGTPEVPTDFETSPYLRQRPYYERLLQSLGDRRLNVTWETNRGCPYSCSYCDWGSATMSKVRRFGEERIQQEIDFITRELKPYFMFLADANFGLFPRDVDIAEQLDAAYRETGFPVTIYFSAAKNNPDRTVAIAKLFASSGLAATHFLAVQHTNAEVLACTDRRNISSEKYRQVVRELVKDGVPIAPQLILGIPGDTLTYWKDCLTDLMDWGIHDNYYVFLYSLLPNAPAADPAFMRQWEIHAVERRIESSCYGRYPKERHGLVPTRIITGSKTFTEDDWVEMRVFATLIQALHGRGITQGPALYARYTHGIPFRTFYDAVIDDFITGPGSRWRDISNRLREHFARVAKDPDALDVMEVDELPDLPYVMTPHLWAFIQICMKLDAFCAELGSFLADRFPAATHIGSAVDFQKHLVHIAPYDFPPGKSFVTDFDWLSYLQRAKRMTDFAYLPEPESTPGLVLEITEERSSRGDHEYGEPLTDEERWSNWIGSYVSQDGSRPMFRAADICRPALVE